MPWSMITRYKHHSARCKSATVPTGPGALHVRLAAGRNSLLSAAVSVTRAGGNTEPGVLSAVTDVKARDGRRRNKIVGAAEAKAVNQDACGRPTSDILCPRCAPYCWRNSAKRTCLAVSMAP